MELIVKIEAVRRKLRESYQLNNGKIAINFSGGKDSTVLLHIARSIFPHIRVVFSNTTNEIKDILDFVKTYENIEIVKPKMSFISVLKKEGFPVVSKEVSQKVNELKNTNGSITRNTRMFGDKKGNGRLATKWRFLAEQDFEVTHKCCKILKKDPLENWSKKTGLTPVIALMADESMLRKQLSLYGEDNGKKIYPFLKTGWTESDIWEYAERNNLRFAECYYDRMVNGAFVPKRIRTGCEFCGFGTPFEKEDRFFRTKILTPKKYKAIMNIENNGVRFEDALALTNGILPLPKVDFYGTFLEKECEYTREKEFLLKDKTILKKCPECSSKDIKKGIKYSKSILDVPEKGKKKVLTITIQSYDCFCCNKPISNKLDLAYEHLGVTKKLYNYIIKRITQKNTEELMDLTGLSFEQLYDIYTEYKTQIEYA